MDINSVMAPILCPVDFSELSANALRLAVLIGKRCSRPVTALYAQWFEAPPYLTASQAKAIEGQLRDALGEAEKELQRFASTAVPGSSVAFRVEEGDPREAIFHVAHAAGSGLIVMGTHGRAGLRRLTLGSVAEEVLHRSNVPILTIHPADRVESISKIVCAVNDSDVSRRALAYAARLAGCLAARLTVVHVLEESDRRGIPDLCSWVAEQDRSGCEIEEVTRHGDAAEQITRLAAEQDAGLLAIGLEHRLFRDKTVIGATASQLVRHAPCAVLTVTGGTTDVIPDQDKPSAR